MLHLPATQVSLRAACKTFKCKCEDFAQTKRQLSQSCGNFQTHYEVLGLQRDATGKEIKEAFLKLSKKHHPDVRGSDRKQTSHDRFVAIIQAYDVLGKDKSKRIYDLGLPKELHAQNEPKRGSTHYYYAPTTFEERARMAGYRSVNPRFFKDTQLHYYTAAACFAFVIFGVIIHFSIAR